MQVSLGFCSATQKAEMMSSHLTVELDSKDRGWNFNDPLGDIGSLEGVGDKGGEENDCLQEGDEATARLVEAGYRHLCFKHLNLDE